MRYDAGHRRMEGGHRTEWAGGPDALGHPGRMLEDPAHGGHEGFFFHRVQLWHGERLGGAHECAAPAGITAGPAAICRAFCTAKKIRSGVHGESSSTMPVV